MFVHAGIDTGGAMSWAVAARPLRRHGGVFSFENCRAQKGTEMLLKDKVAVIYGAGGAIGGAVARALAAEGATSFLTGRRLAPVSVVADDIVSDGGAADAAELDALDEQAVDDHLRSVIDTAGRVDVSFNAVGLSDPGILGVPLVELDVDHFCLPIAAYATSYFLTARRRRGT